MFLKPKKIKNTLAVKYFLLAFVFIFFSSFYKFKHPFYLGVIDISYNSKQKSMPVSVKLFTNDLEDALKKTFKKNVNILNQKLKVENDSLLAIYIKKNLTISLNLKKQKIDYIGYEKEEDAIWIYFEIKNVSRPKNITIETTLLYEFINQQIIIIHAQLDGIKKSNKITNPENKTEFIF